MRSRWPAVLMLGFSACSGSTPKQGGSDAATKRSDGGSASADAGSHGSADAGGKPASDAGAKPAQDGSPTIIVDAGAALCDPVTLADGMILHVNPVDGDDALATGSGTLGTVAKPACAFRSITAAAAAATAATQPSMTILVDPTADANASTGEIFPITIPANTKLTAAAGAIVTVQCDAGDAFHMSNDNSTLDALVIDGNGSAKNGIVVSAGSSSKPNVLSDVEVKAFTASGVRVERGSLTITAATNVHSNGVGSSPGSGPGPAGLLALDTAIVSIDGKGATSQKPTQFASNTGNGIEVRGQARVNVDGMPSQLTPGEGTVVVKSNSLAGIFVEQLLVAAGASGPAGMLMTGVVSTLNQGSGMQLFAGSGVTLRSSYISNNTAHGVLVPTDPGFVSGGSGANDGNDLERLDFGVAADLGHNVLQDAANPNTLKGVCLALTAGKGTGLLKLQGNVFASGGVTVDCSQIAGALPATGDCIAQGPLGDSGGNPKNDFDVTQCTVP